MYKFTLSARVLTILAIVAVAGCASRPPMPMPQPQPEPTQPPGQATPLPSGQAPIVRQPPTQPQQAPQQLPPSSPQEISSPAVMALLGHADTQARAGHMRSAAATLQRALNIEPRNPFIYQRLAAVRLAQKQLDQAAALAYKSNSLAVGNPFIQADNWRLIAEVMRLRGDSAGQREAMQRVRQYRLQSAALQ